MRSYFAREFPLQFFLPLKCRIVQMSKYGRPICHSPHPSPESPLPLSLTVAYLSSGGTENDDGFASFPRISRFSKRAKHSCSTSRRGHCPFLYTWFTFSPIITPACPSSPYATQYNWANAHVRVLARRIVVYLDLEGRLFSPPLLVHQIGRTVR